MHELSIVMSIIETSLDEMHTAGSDAVLEVELEIGELSGIDMLAFDFAWNEAIKNTPLQHATLHIIKPKGTAICLDCDNSFVTESIVNNCPKCKSAVTYISKGKELKIKSLVVA